MAKSREPEQCYYHHCYLTTVQGYGVLGVTGLLRVGSHCPIGDLTVTMHAQKSCALTLGF